MTASMDWLQGLDPSQGNSDANNFDLPLGKHRAVTDKPRVVTYPAKDGKPELKQFRITFLGVEGAAKGKHLDRKISLPGPGADAERIQQAQDSMARLFKDLGIPKERHNAVQPDDLDAIPVIVEVYDNKRGYRTVGGVKLDRGTRVGSDEPLSNSSNVLDDDLDLPDF